ncbi:MAG: hypothetical protein OXE99_05380 [Cellvibrionales bacterium]|nr:hypothetical protein [Cellvibrionales bacterium]
MPDIDCENHQKAAKSAIERVVRYVAKCFPKLFSSTGGATDIGLATLHKHSTVDENTRVVEKLEIRQGDPVLVSRPRDKSYLDLDDIYPCLWTADGIPLEWTEDNGARGLIPSDKFVALQKAIKACGAEHLLGIVQLKKQSLPVKDGQILIERNYVNSFQQVDSVLMIKTDERECKDMNVIPTRYELRPEENAEGIVEVECWVFLVCVGKPRYHTEGVKHEKSD